MACPWGMAQQGSTHLTPSLLLSLLCPWCDLSSRDMAFPSSGNWLELNEDAPEKGSQAVATATHLCSPACN